MTNIYFDEKCVPNNDYVVIRIIDNANEVKVGGIVLAESSFSNEKLAFGKIEAVGKTAHEKYGLEEDQYCLFDRLATFYHTEPICIVKYENVIVLTNADRSDYFPVKGTLFVDETKDEAYENKKGVFVVETAEDAMHLGKITAMWLSEDDAFPFAIGDKVMLVKGADHVQLNGRSIFVYKPESVIVKIEDK